MSEQTPTPLAALPSSARYGLLLFVALPCLPGLIFLLAGIITDPHHQQRDTSPAGEIKYAKNWERTRSLYLAGAVVLMGGTMLSAGVVWKIVRAAKAAQEGEAVEVAGAPESTPAPSTPPTNGYEAILRSEFDAEEGSFLTGLRCGLKWDKAAFSRLITAMEVCAAANEGVTTVPKWVADGFWCTSYFVRDWSTHSNFPKEHAPEYYEAAYERLWDLAFWFFTNNSPAQKPLPPL